MKRKEKTEIKGRGRENVTIWQQVKRKNRRSKKHGKEQLLEKMGGNSKKQRQHKVVSSLKHFCGVEGAALSVHAESCDGWIDLAAKRTQPTEDVQADDQLAHGSKT